MITSGCILEGKSIFTTSHWFLLFPRGVKMKLSTDRQSLTVNKTPAFIFVKVSLLLCGGAVVIIRTAALSHNNNVTKKNS